MDAQPRATREALDRSSPGLDRRREQVRRRNGLPRAGRREQEEGEEEQQQPRARRRRAARVRALLARTLLPALLAAGCAHDAHAPAPAPRVSQHAFELAHGFLHVEVSIPEDPPGRKPAVIGALGLEEALLSRGIAVVHFSTDWSVLRPLAEARTGAGPDSASAADAGTEPEPEPEPDPEPEPNRVGAWLLAAPRPGIVGRDYFGIVHATAKSVSTVVDRVASLPGIDPRRIAIAGSSTHGFVALEALRLEPRLAAGVVRVACGDYHRFLRSSSLALADDPRWLADGELALDADYEEVLRSREPIRFPDAYPPRPLLLQNGARDPAIPVDCARATALALERAYREAGVPERFRFRLDPEAGHDLGDDAERAVLRWWERWLLEPRPGGGDGADGVGGGS